MTVAQSAPAAVSTTGPSFRRRNAALLAQLGKAILRDAAVLDGIPNGAMLVLLPTDADREFIDASIVIGVDMLDKGHNVYFRHLEPGEWGINFADIATDDADAPGDGSSE